MTPIYKLHGAEGQISQPNVLQLFQRGNEFLAQGAYAQAAEQFQSVLAADPQSAEAHNNLGIAYKRQHQLNAAGVAFQRAVALRGNYLDAFVNLGDTLRQLDRLEDARMCLQAALEIDDQSAAAHNNLGIVLKRQGEHEEAITCFLRALELKPDYAEAAGNLGNVQSLIGQLDKAAQNYRRAIDADATPCDAHNHMGLLLQRQGKLEAAATEFQQALQIDSNYIHAYINLGVLYLAQGRVAEAQKSFRQALQIKPQFAKAHSNLLIALGYDLHIDPDELFAEHRRWCELHAAHLPRVVEHAQTPDPCRRLRVGYVSPDLRQHPVATFLEPVLRYHRGSQVEVICYSDVAIVDATTHRLQALADGWHNVAGMSDADLAAQVVRDEIDILVDLAGHTAGNRLLVFARGPAPVQFSMTGYGATSGLPSIGYRITDAQCDPVEEPSRYTEQLVRLPSGSFVFAAPESAPDIQPPPVLEKRHVTFGSFNNLAKIGPEVVEIWAGILTAIPNSRLLLKNGAFEEPAVQQRYAGLFAQHGVAASRIEFQGYLPQDQDHLAAYHNVDIALDPFPYTGAATTCEALWMGVPVITLRGRNYVGRMSAGILTQAGCGYLIAESAAQYVSTAVGLASDVSQLVDLREGLRERLQTSSVCQADLIVGELETAYRQAWQQWCSGRGVSQDVEPRELLR